MLRHVGRKAAAILPLIGVEAGLLALQQVYGKTQPAFHHLDRAGGSLACQQAGGGAKSLLAPQRHLRTFDHAAAAGEFEQQARQFRFAPVDRQRTRLQHQVVAKAIHRQPRQSIVFGVDQAQRARVLQPGRAERMASAAARRSRQNPSSMGRSSHVSRRTWIWLRRFR